MIRGSWLLPVLVLAGCSMPGYVKTAYYGDLPSLKREIHAASERGRLSGPDVVALAEAVARRELRSARGADVLARIAVARSCVRAVEPELRERAEAADDGAASALLVLSDAGRLARGPLVERYARAESGAFRAVAARGTAAPEHAALRQTFYSDPDERVRREALRAGFEAAAPPDLDLLLEAARLDPDPQNRSLATRAIGAIGGPRALTGLADLWVRAEQALQLAIVDAWSMPRVFAAGGEDQLVRLAESGSSMAAVVAAGALVRAGDPAASARHGRAVLARAVKEGTTDERLLAIQLVPLSDADGTAALDVAAKSDDPAVRVVALARLLEVPARRAAALTELRVVAKGQDAAARQARLALAAADDASAAPLLQAQLTTDGPGLRERAALALFRLGKAAQMATALADPDPSVRMHLACSLLGPRPGSG